MNFGVIVKRRTILKTLAFVLSLGFLYYIMSYKELSKDSQPNMDLTWSKFTKDCGKGISDYKSVYNYDK